MFIRIQRVLRLNRERIGATLRGRVDVDERLGLRVGGVVSRSVFVINGLDRHVEVIYDGLREDESESDQVTCASVFRAAMRVMGAAKLVRVHAVSCK